MEPKHDISPAIPQKSPDHNLRITNGVNLGFNTFRVKYRQAITEQVAAIIRACCGRKEAVARLRRWAGESVIESDRKRFVAAAEETLAGIHEGNFARYRIRPSEFMSWKAAWTSAGNTKA